MLATEGAAYMRIDEIFGAKVGTQWVVKFSKRQLSSCLSRTIPTLVLSETVLTAEDFGPSWSINNDHSNCDLHANELLPGKVQQQVG